MSESMPETPEQSNESGDKVVSASDEVDFVPEVDEPGPHEVSTKGVLPALAKRCEELLEAHAKDPDVSTWVELDPPTAQQEQNSPSIIGNWNGRPVKTGFMVDDKTEENSDVGGLIMHRVYRTAKYDVHFRVREIEYYGETEYSPVGLTDENGQIEVTIPEKSDAAGTLNLVAQMEYADGTVSEGMYSSEGEVEEGALAIAAEGEIAPGATVTATVTDADGDSVHGADVFMDGPVKLATGEVFVKEIEGYK